MRVVFVPVDSSCKGESDEPASVPAPGSGDRLFDPEVVNREQTSSIGASRGEQIEAVPLDCHFARGASSSPLPACRARLCRAYHAVSRARIPLELRGVPVPRGRRVSFRSVRDTQRVTGAGLAGTDRPRQTSTTWLLQVLGAKLPSDGTSTNIRVDFFRGESNSW